MKIEAEGNLLCRAIQHEIDHLDGELYIDKAVSKLAADLELTKHGFREGDVSDLEKTLSAHGAVLSTKTTEQAVIG
jgi:hypothetical protein